MQTVEKQDIYETRNMIWSQEYSDKNNRKRYTVISHIEPTNSSKSAGFDIRKFLEIENGEIIPTKSGVRLPDNIIVSMLEALFKNLDVVQRNDLMERLDWGRQ